MDAMTRTRRIKIKGGEGRNGGRRRGCRVESLRGVGRSFLFFSLSCEQMKNTRAQSRMAPFYLWLPGRRIMNGAFARLRGVSVDSGLIIRTRREGTPKIQMGWCPQKQLGVCRKMQLFERGMRHIVIRGCGAGNDVYQLAE